MEAGPLSMLLGHALFGVVPVLLKLGLQGGLDTSSAVVMRFAVALGMVFGLAWGAAKWWPRGRKELSLAPVNRRGLFWRGVWGGVAVLTFFFAVQLCGAGLGTLLNYTLTLWSNVFGALFFGHRPAKGFWPLLALAALGLWLVIDPSGGPGSHAGIVIGLLSGMAGGAAVLTIKNLRRTDNALTINLALALGGLALGLPLMALRGLQGTPVLLPQAGPWAWVALSGVFSFGGQYYFNHGFKGTSVALASLIALSTPVLACLSGWLFLGEALTPHFLAGALCILVACGAMGWSERMAAAPGSA